MDNYTIRGVAETSNLKVNIVSKHRMSWDVINQVEQMKSSFQAVEDDNDTKWAMEIIEVVNENSDEPPKEIFRSELFQEPENK